MKNHKVIKVLMLVMVVSILTMGSAFALNNLTKNDLVVPMTNLTTTKYVDEAKANTLKVAEAKAAEVETTIIFRKN